jgi:hypothetical protein
MKTWCVNQHAADVSESFTKASHVGLGADVEDFVRSKTSQQVLPHLAQCRTGVILAQQSKRSSRDSCHDGQLAKNDGPGYRRDRS